jgi:hypothetical protein
VLDLTDSTQPRDVGFAPTAGIPHQAAVLGHYLYVVQSRTPLPSDNGLSVFDVSDPILPRPIGRVEMPAHCTCTTSCSSRCSQRTTSFISITAPAQATAPARGRTFTWQTQAAAGNQSNAHVSRDVLSHVWRAQGPVGLMATAGAKVRGAGLIFAVESIPARQELAHSPPLVGRTTSLAVHLVGWRLHDSLFCSNVCSNPGGRPWHSLALIEPLDRPSRVPQALSGGLGQVW